MGEAIWMILMVACPLILWSLFLTGAARWFWFSVMSGCLACVLVGELVSKLTSGATISQHFWHWSELHPMTAVVTIALLLVGWIMLLVHLSWRLLKKYVLKK